LLPFALVNLAHWMLPTSMHEGKLGYVAGSSCANSGWH
jgi:hypothetical protein